MVTKKNRSLRTMGPISAISSREEGSTPFSESSCRPEMISCAATKNRIAVVTRKNFCRLIRTLPLTNITPNAMATITPDKVPRKLSSSVEFSETAPRIRTVSTPSRKTIRKTNRNRPNLALLPGQEADFAFNLSLKRSACLHHENDHGDDEEGGNQHDPAFENVLVPLGARQQDGNADAADEGGDQGGEDRFAQFGTADFGQIGQGDADDKGGFDPLAQRNDEGLQHLWKTQIIATRLQL